MIKELIEIMTLLFNRDNACIEQIKEQFEDVSYERPPVNVAKYVKESLNDESIECVSAFQHDTTIENSDGLKIPEGSFDMWFRFKDIRIKRRKIFRLGDYYLRVISTGFDKYMFRFYTKHRRLVKREYKYVDNFYLAQHPHVSTGVPCFAGMEQEIMCSISNYNLGGFLWNIKNFLQSWNYRSPHHNPERFEALNVSIPDKIDGKDYEFLSYIQPVPNSSRLKCELEPYRQLRHGIESKSVALKLTPARCKLYKTEPLSRLLYEIASLNDNQRRDMFSRQLYNINRRNNFIVNFAEYLKLMMAHPEGYEENDFIYLVHYIWDILTTKVQSSIRQQTPEWTDENYAFLNEIKNYINMDLKYYQNAPNSGFAEYRLFYLGNDPSVSDVIKEKVRRLLLIRDKLEQIRDKSDSDYISSTIVKKDAMVELSKCISYDVFKYDLEHCLSELWLYEVDSNTTDEINDKLKAYRDEFESLKVILTKAMNKELVHYHQTEIRRLTSGNENNVQIDNLNI
jgi:hypothetical protein|tara:strand:+ start:1466 stop:2998 length:1533 start_codon:yes stop_codon:yes gene_type:complete